MRNARVLVLIGILVAGVAGFLATRISPVQVPLVGIPHTSDTGTPPIVISGDAGWSTCPWVNGSGTWGDPYALTALTINGTNSASCILIANTRAVFRIENCNVSNAGSSGNQAGIELNNVTNGILLNNTCKNNAMNGIYVGTSTNITITGTYCTGNGWGVRVAGSNRTTITNGNFSRNSNLITMDSRSNNNTITGNFFKKNGGNYVWNAGSGNTISGNTYIDLPWMSSWGYTPYLTAWQDGYFQCSGAGGVPLLNYWWNFGDGKGDFIGYTSIQHHFTQGGTYNVSFAVADAEGDQDLHLLSIVVSPPKFTVSIHAPQMTINAGERISFSASPAGGTSPYSYQWNFGDGTVNSTGPTPLHQYTTAGQYYVLLTVTDAHGFSVTTGCLIAVNGKDSQPISVSDVILVVLIVVGITSVILIGPIVTSHSKNPDRRANPSTNPGPRSIPVAFFRDPRRMQSSPVPGTITSLIPAYCPTCGKHHAPGDRFCSYCGTQLPSLPTLFP